MKLYHATTQKKAKQYRQSGVIHAPVRGFTTMQAAMAWAMKVGRTDPVPPGQVMKTPNGEVRGASRPHGEASGSAQGYSADDRREK